MSLALDVGRLRIASFADSSITFTDPKIGPLLLSRPRGELARLAARVCM